MILLLEILLIKKQYESILAIAICFTNAIDEHVQQLGYRIISQLLQPDKKLYSTIWNCNKQGPLSN